MEKLHPIMFAGTGSDVGKSVIAAAFCRIFLQDGYRPAPFKAQNMALNSFATPDGLEIGRAQAVQAEAAGIECSTDMNPLLLKPNSNHTSQVVLNGRPAGNKSAYDYFRRDVREELRREVRSAFDRLSLRYNPVVMEGAGSISEINLRDTDIVNMSMAMYAKADVVLVGDIDRGGVFASVYGSILLQRPEERRRIKGILINKFRGDLRLFEDGRRMMEELCGVPVLGVIPYFNGIHIEEEDSVALAAKARKRMAGRVNVAVVLLRHLSNFTDFDALERDPRVHLYYTSSANDMVGADIIVVPGSKNTMDDLCGLRRSGLAKAITEGRKRGATVVGVCGGYQMLGLEVCDPDRIESGNGRLPGLGLLPVTTTITARKTTRQRLFAINEALPGEKPHGGQPTMTGYEIHMGETHIAEGASAQPLTVLDDGTTDGCRVDERCFGTYLHGIFDNSAFVDRLLKPHSDKTEAAPALDYAAYKNRQYDLLADHVRRHVDMERLYDILKA